MYTITTVDMEHLKLNIYICIYIHTYIDPHDNLMAKKNCVKAQQNNPTDIIFSVQTVLKL